MRHIELAHRNFDFHSGVIDFAEDFNNPPDGLGVARGLLENFDGDHLPWLGGSRLARRNQNVVLDPLVFRNDNGNTAFGKQSANQASVCALSDLDNCPLGLATTIEPSPFDQDAIAMHRFLHFAGSQKNVWTTIVGNQEAKPIAMSRNPARYEIKLARKQKNAFAVGQQLPVTLHRRKAFSEDVQRHFGDGKPLAQFLRGQRGIGFTQTGENRLTGRNRGRHDCRRR